MWIVNVQGTRLECLAKLPSRESGARIGGSGLGGSPFSSQSHFTKSTCVNEWICTQHSGMQVDMCVCGEVGFTESVVFSRLQLTWLSRIILIIVVAARTRQGNKTATGVGESSAAEK
jgi:hypothetical protein